MVGGEYDYLELYDKRAIDMRTRLAQKKKERGEGAVKHGRHRLVPKVSVGSKR